MSAARETDLVGSSLRHYHCQRTQASVTAVVLVDTVRIDCKYLYVMRSAPALRVTHSNFTKTFGVKLESLRYHVALIAS